MALLNYTTKIQAEKTASEIQRILANHGARAVMIEYDIGGQIEALSFKAQTPNGDVGIKLPIDIKATMRVMERQVTLRKIPRSFANEGQARRVAWRIIKDWVEAQMAILETEMVKLEQIFLPYVVSDDGRTVYERLLDSKFQLPEGQG